MYGRKNIMYIWVYTFFCFFSTLLIISEVSPLSSFVFTFFWIFFFFFLSFFFFFFSRCLVLERFLFNFFFVAEWWLDDDSLESVDLFLDRRVLLLLLDVDEPEWDRLSSRLCFDFFLFPDTDRFLLLRFSLDV